MNLFMNCSGVHLTNGLKWLNEPEVWDFNKEALYVAPDGKTDVFRKYGHPARDNACFFPEDQEVTAHRTYRRKIVLDPRDAVR
jgi:regulation of enolase protein 1 (concanavalin A-like superfamily)